VVATGPVTLNASGGSTLSFVANGGTNPTVLQQTASLYTVAIPLVLSAPTTFGGSGSGLVTLSNVLSGGGGLSFTGANWRITNAANSFTGGLIVGTGASVELAPAGSPASVNLTLAATSIVGSNSAANPITINGGTLKLTTTGTGNITFGDNRALTFGANGGVLDIRNSGTAGGGNIVNSATNDLALTLNNAPGNPAIIKFNGGQNGLSNNVVTDGNWVSAGNTLRIESYTGLPTNPLRIELENGAMFLNRAATVPVPVTVRGVIGVGADPTSGPTASVNANLSLTTGRIVLDTNNIHNYQQGLTLEGALQISCAGATRAIDGNVTLVNGAYVAFNGRGTGTAIGPAINPIGTAGNVVGQNPLWLGQGGDDTLTIQSGAIAVFDSRIRHEQTNNNAVLMNANAVIQGGAELRITQSLSRATAVAAAAAGQTGTNSTTSIVGHHIIDGDIQGQGSTASESVLSIYLPFPAGTDSNADQVPDTASFGDFGGVVFRNNSTATSPGTNGTDLIVNGTGFGGLRVEGRSRPNLLFDISGTMSDTVSNATKIANLLTQTRLAGLTGSGGYLTTAANGATFNFPDGGEWGAIVPVGLKVADSNVGGADVSLALIASASFTHNLHVSANATLDTGSAAFTFGPNTATPGLGTLSGNGTISGTGGLTLAAGGILSPGEDGIGTLTEANNLSLTSGSKYVFDLATVAGSDLVATFGTLTLGGQQFSDFTFNTLPGFGAGTYTLFDNTLIAGSLGAGVTGTIGGLGATISISGNDVVVSVVPEPGAALSIIGGCAVLLGLRRRRAA
jgi:hypothetical protein